jgi:AAA domain
MNPAKQIPPPAYFGSLTIENVKCFKGKHEIDLSDGNGKPAMWTVILGNNNTGKTTLLRCLANLELIEIKSRDYPDGNFMPKAYIKSPLVENSHNILCDLIIGQSIISSVFIWEKYSKTPLGNFVISRPSILINKNFSNAIMYGYGTARKMGSTSLSENENQDNTESLFNDNVTLTNSEEWLLQTYFAEKLNKPNAAETLKRIKGFN